MSPLAGTETTFASILLMVSEAVEEEGRNIWLGCIVPLSPPWSVCMRRQIVIEPLRQ